LCINFSHLQIISPINNPTIFVNDFWDAVNESLLQLNLAEYSPILAEYKFVNFFVCVLVGLAHRWNRDNMVTNIFVFFTSRPVNLCKIGNKWSLIIQYYLQVFQPSLDVNFIWLFPFVVVCQCINGWLIIDHASTQRDDDIFILILAILQKVRVGIFLNLLKFQLTELLPSFILNEISDGLQRLMLLYYCFSYLLVDVNHHRVIFLLT
jgi:hypothetical protein